MPIRWNSTLNGSWEITLSEILVERSLDMGEESVSVSLLSPPFAAPGLVLRGSDLDGEGEWKGDGSETDSGFVLLSLHTPSASSGGREC